MNPRNPKRIISQNLSSRRINSEEKLISYIKKKLGEPIIKVEVTEDQIKQNIDDAFRKFSDWAFSGEERMFFIIDAQPDVQDYILDERIRSIIGVSFASGLQNYSGGQVGTYGFMGLSMIPLRYLYGIGNGSALNASDVYPDSTAYGDTSTIGIAGSVTSDGQLYSNGLGTAWAMLANYQSIMNMFSKNVDFEYIYGTHTLRIFESLSGKLGIEAELEYIPTPDYDDNYGHPWIKEYATALTKLTWGQNIGKFSQTLVGGAQLNYDRIISEAREDLERLEEELIDKWSRPLGIYSG